MTWQPTPAGVTIEFEELPASERVPLPGLLKRSANFPAAAGSSAAEHDRADGERAGRAPGRSRAEGGRAERSCESACEGPPCQSKRGDGDDVADGRRAGVFVTGDGEPVRFAVQHDGTRDRTVERKIEANGGIVVREKADLILVQHGTSCAHGEVYHRYDLVDECIRQKKMIVGAELARFQIPPAGARVGRSAFTAEEDRELREHLLALPSRKRKGNQAYQELAAKHPKSGHTWQSWRSRAVKKVLPSIEKAEIPEAPGDGIAVNERLSDL